jgi:hypothetical protein
MVNQTKVNPCDVLEQEGFGIYRVTLERGCEFNRVPGGYESGRFGTEMSGSLDIDRWISGFYRNTGQVGSDCFTLYIIDEDPINVRAEHVEGIEKLCDLPF